MKSEPFRSIPGPNTIWFFFLNFYKLFFVFFSYFSVVLSPLLRDGNFCFWWMEFWLLPSWVWIFPARCYLDRKGACAQLKRDEEAKKESQIRFRSVLEDQARGRSHWPAGHTSRPISCRPPELARRPEVPAFSSRFLTTTTDGPAGFPLNGRLARESRSSPTFFGPRPPGWRSLPRKLSRLLQKVRQEILQGGTP